MKKAIITFAIAVITLTVFAIGLCTYVFIDYGFVLECLIVTILAVAVGGHFGYVLHKAIHEMPMVCKYRLDKTTIEEIEEIAKEREICEVKFTDKYLIIEFEG